MTPDWQTSTEHLSSFICMQLVLSVCTRCSQCYQFAHDAVSVISLCTIQSVCNAVIVISLHAVMSVLLACTQCSQCYQFDHWKNTLVQFSLFLLQWTVILTKEVGNYARCKLCLSLLLTDCCDETEEKPVFVGLGLGKLIVCFRLPTDPLKNVRLSKFH